VHLGCRVGVMIVLVLWVGHLGLLLAGRFRVFGLGVGGGHPTGGLVPGGGNGVEWLVGALVPQWTQVGLLSRVVVLPWWGLVL
jgi:hypothetical protein